MVSVVLPSLLATQAGGRRLFEVDATTVEGALRGLPVADLIFDGSAGLRPLVNVYLEGEDVRRMDGLATPVSGGQTVRVVAAVAGG
jgi:molybdopterin converting factor small subunit